MSSRRILSALAAILAAAALSSCPLGAQDYDVLRKVKDDPRLSWGMEGPHRFDGIPALSRPPKGYKAFYIGHYGRHGSRTAWSTRTYTTLRDVFAAARRKGVLTAYGEEFARKYEAFYEEPLINAGDLVPLGFEQQERIGQFVGRSFPEVFKSGRKVEAISSTAQRSIVSMGAFTLGLKGVHPKLAIRNGSSHRAMTVCAPPSAPKELRRYFAGEDFKTTLESNESFRERKLDASGILGKLFTDSSFLDEREGGSWQFLKELFQLYTGYHNYEPEPLFDDLLTDDQRVAFWEVDNYSSFRGDITARYSEIPLLEDFIAKAEEAFADPSRAADLRFGHDYVLEALATLLDLDGCGTVVDDPDQAKYYFQSYNIPMAATLLFVCYKDRKGDILFKVLLNEKEVLLPQLTPVNGPYYRWGDFRSWADKLLAEHPQTAPSN